ncbi:MAG: dienelactone hydrolase family protein [Acidimicrobiales bacterium]|nr:dienelactone hydrolase family protein [Acidimicrobiales bacterium]
MIQREVDVRTDDGVMKTFIHHPTYGGPHPIVLYLMDAPSIRPALHEMASRLASAGYYVMLPYLFYRGGPFKEFGEEDADMHERFELMQTVTPSGVLTDGAALLELADGDGAAVDGPAGAVGFCMSGGLTLTLAKQYPDRVKAAASIHGAWLVRDGDDSPHRGLDAMDAEAYLAWCDEDPTAPKDDLETVRSALTEAGVEHTIDFLTDAVHGFAPPHGERYDREASELHWERVHALLRRRVG